MRFKDTAKREYVKIKPVNCPAFIKEKIVFNAKGFNHIFYKGARSDRGYKDIQTRVRLLGRAVVLLKKSRVVQEESSYKTEYRGKVKELKFWAFEGIIEDRRIKVIVRQVGRGKKHFWSVIPAWRSVRFGNKVKNYRNNPAKF